MPSCVFPAATARGALLVALLLLLGAAIPAAGSPYDAAFWDHWGDGRAEMNGYDLRFPRYGEMREGTAVAVFVSETFRHDQRVKTERAEAVDAPTYPVMKLNLMEDFPTGVYDYNLMTSVFVALQPVAGRRAGLPVKVSFSAQEWCGQVWWQGRFDEGEVAVVSHSYFEDEADRREVLPLPADGGAEDALFLWARRLAAPFLEAGASTTTTLLTAPRRGRLAHRAERPVPARLTWAAARKAVEVPAGRFDALVHTAVLEEGAGWTLWTTADPPHLLLRWEDPRGAVGELRASTRMRYWQRNQVGGEADLKALGLKPRPPHTP